METFSAATTRILRELKAAGWSVKDRNGLKPLKVPHATNDDGVRLWFKPQAIWCSHGLPASLSDATSICMDRRGVSVAELCRLAEVSA